MTDSEMCTLGERAPLSVVVLTYNEERNLPPCLASVAGWVREVFVVDSGSTDTTPVVAAQYGAQVFQHAFGSHAAQWNWALRTLPFSCEWALCLDADHRVSPELRDEICELYRESDIAPIPKLSGIDGFFIKRQQIFRGAWIRHGGYDPKYLLKLVRHERAWSDERELADHHLYVTGQSSRLLTYLIEDNQNESDILTWTQKHVAYVRRQAEEEFLRWRDGGGWSIRPSFFGTPDQRTLWLKRLWYRLPLYVRPFLYFSYRYFLRLGLLDGKQGFVFHVLQGFWYRLLVDIVLDDIRRLSGRTPGSIGVPIPLESVPKAVESAGGSGHQVR